MGTLALIRSGLKTRLDTRVSAYANWPDTINTPCALVKPASQQFHQTSGGLSSSRISFEVTLLAAPIDAGLDDAQSLLDSYLDESGTASIKAALEADPTLSGVVSDLIVRGWKGYGSRAVNGVEYLGATFDVEVIL